MYDPARHLDLALAGRLDLTDDSVEVDPTPTGFPPADRLLAAVLAERRLGTVAPAHRRRGTALGRRPAGSGAAPHPPERCYTVRQLAVRIAVGLVVAYAVFVAIAVTVQG